MYGAILGDMIGAPYEFDRGNKSKDFEMFNSRVRYTDDTAMTLAVCKALMLVGRDATEQDVKAAVVREMQDIGSRYATGEYGGRFAGWLKSSDPKPYNSFGNGSAMRVSSVGWLYDDLDKTREVARWTAEVTHNHPEGIKGAESVAAAIFMARTGSSKEEIRKYVEYNFGYDFSRTCDEIRPTYCHKESCQETVPEAFTAFFEGNDFEDVIRTAVSLGGDCDTLTCIAGAIAEAFYDVPDEMMEECDKRLPEELYDILWEFVEQYIWENKFGGEFMSVEEMQQIIDSISSAEDLIEAYETAHSGFIYEEDRLYDYEADTEEYEEVDRLVSFWEETWDELEDRLYKKAAEEGLLSEQLSDAGMETRLEAFMNKHGYIYAGGWWEKKEE